jgi:hypothetical protein
MASSSDVLVDRWRVASTSLLTRDLLGWRLIRHAIKVGALVGDSDIFQTIVEVLKALVVADEEAVTTVHSELALGHLLGLLDLRGVELDSGRLGSLAVVIVILVFAATLCWLLVNISVLSRTLLLVRSILLRNFIFHDVYGAALKFLPNLFLFPFPGIFDAVAAVALVLADLALFFALVHLRHELKVEQGVVEHFKVLHLLGDGLFNLYLDLLVRTNLLLVNEVAGRLNQTDFVIQ